MFETQRDLLQHKIGYRFADIAFLNEALTHRSYANEQRGKRWSDNERLEFLGDAVLDLIIGEELFLRFAELPEGELTRIRAEVVNAEILAEAARSIALGTALRLGRGEEKTGGRNKDNILADALEAVIGAIFRDSGYETARRVVLGLLDDWISRSVNRSAGSDYKTRLQEYMQARRMVPPDYVVAAIHGPAHERIFAIEVQCDGQVLGRGDGKSKKEAEQSAAQQALAQLQA